VCQASSPSGTITASGGGRGRQPWPGASPAFPPSRSATASPSPLVTPTAAATVCSGRTYGSHRQLHPRALQAYRCSLCRGPLVDGESTAPGGARVSHIRRAPKGVARGEVLALVPQAPRRPLPPKPQRTGWIGALVLGSQAPMRPCPLGRRASRTTLYQPRPCGAVEAHPNPCSQGPGPIRGRGRHGALSEKQPPAGEGYRICTACRLRGWPAQVRRHELSTLCFHSE
jgi:hypothetical protein